MNRSVKKVSKDSKYGLVTILKSTVLHALLPGQSEMTVQSDDRIVTEPDELS